MSAVITRNPWNNECEACYGKHPFKPGEPMFEVLHPFAPDEPIIICQICLFRWTLTPIAKGLFPVAESK